MVFEKVSRQEEAPICWVPFIRKSVCARILRELVTIFMPHLDKEDVESYQCTSDHEQIDSLHEDKEKEDRVITSSNALVQPLAVMIEAIDTPVTRVAMAASRKHNHGTLWTDLSHVELF